MLKRQPVDLRVNHVQRRVPTGIEHERFLDHSLQLLAFCGFDQAQAVLPRRGNRWQFVPAKSQTKLTHPVFFMVRCMRLGNRRTLDAPARSCDKITSSGPSSTSIGKNDTSPDVRSSLGGELV